MKYLTNLDLSKNELQNMVLQKLATAPANPIEGLIYYDTVDDEPKYYNGTDWIAMNALGATMTGAAIVTAINGSASLIDDDNLSTNVATAISNAHDAVTIEDSTSIDLTLTGQKISASANFGTTVGTICQGNDSRLSDARTPTSHTHGNISNDGKIGSASGLMIKTTTDGVLTTLAQGSSGEYLQHDGTWSTPPDTIYTHPTGDGNSHVPATSTTNNGKVLTAGSTANSASWQTPTVTWANVSSKPSSTVANIDSAVSASHSQNTDTGTTSASFTIGTSGVKVKNSSGTELQVRNNADSDYADIRVKNLYVEGITTEINSTTVNIGDSNIVLNEDITTSAANSNGGISVKRLMVDNATRKDAVLEYNTSSERWQSTFGAVSGTLVTSQLANKVTANLGDNSNTSIVVTHNLNTRDCIVSVRESGSPYALVICDVEYTSVNTITFTFATAPTLNQYVATIIG